MQSNFHEACAQTRAAIAVPSVPIVAIRSAAERVVVRGSGARRKGLIGGLLAGLSLVAVAAAAEIWNATHVSFGPSGGLQLASSDRLHFKKNPTDADVLAAARQAAFPVELPIGLPAGTRPFQMLYGRDIVMISYDLPGAWRRSNHMLWITLTDPRSVGGATHALGNGSDRMELGGTAATGSVKWRIGREMVIVSNSTITPAELAHVKSAMLAQASTR